jgi:hypothetical protein
MSSLLRNELLLVTKVKFNAVTARVTILQGYAEATTNTIDLCDDLLTYEARRHVHLEP